MAIDVRTIQMRRGLAVDFNPAKLLPGEWAVSQDNEKLYMCFTAGRVIEIGTAAAIIQYVQDAEAWAAGTRDGDPVAIGDPTYQNNSKYYSEQGEDSATAAALSETNAATSESNAEAWAVGERGGLPVPSTDDTYENNSKYYCEQSETYWGYVDDAINLVVPDVSINFTTGELEVSGSSWYFAINQTTGNLEWAVSHI